MHIVVKKMETDAEVKGKAYVHWKSWQEAYSGLVDQAYLEELTLEKMEDIAYRWRDHISVAKDGERVVGFVGYGKYRNEELEDTGEIYAIYILSEYYGRGLGLQLMNDALMRLKGYSNVTVWVLENNERAIRFYRRCGFEFDGRSEEIRLGSLRTKVRMTLER